MPAMPGGPVRRVGVAQLRFVARVGLGLVLALCGVWHALVSPWPAIARLEAALADLRSTSPRDLPPDAAPFPDLVIVDIDDASLAQVGHWPWARHTLAALTRALAERERAAVIAFDLVFPEAAPGDDDLAHALAGAPAVLGCYLSGSGPTVGHADRPDRLPTPLALPGPMPTPGSSPWQSGTGNAAPLAAAAPTGGCLNVQPDADGVVRALPAVLALGPQRYPSLDLAILHRWAGSPPIEAEAGPTGQVRHLGWTGLRGAQGWSLDERSQWRPRFDHRLHRVSAADVLAGRLPPGAIAGQIALIGSSAPGLGDLRPTAVDPAMPGVDIHAHLLATLLTGRDLTRPDWAPGWEVLLVTLSLGAMGWAARRPAAPQALLTGLGMMAALWLLPAALARSAGWWLPSASALVLAGLYFGVLSAWQYWRQWQRRLALEQLFRQYLPPAKARALARQPEASVAEARMAEVTVLFCDLRGFSGIAETLPPMALRQLLNQYFSLATQLVHRHDGTLDKFIGDAVMAFWGAPEPQADHARRAVQAALDLLDALPALNRQLQSQGLPALDIGVGLASGMVCVGDLGSDLRRSYTAIGDAVNIAARLEALTRAQGLPLLVDEQTRRHCGESADLVWLEVDRVQVKGRQQFVTIFTPVRCVGGASPQQQEQARTWTLALAAARTEDESNVRALMTRLDELAIAPDPTPRWTATLNALAASLARRWEASRPHDHP